MSPGPRQAARPVATNLPAAVPHPVRLPLPPAIPAAARSAPVTPDPTPFHYHDLMAELAETLSPQQVDLWLLGTVARRNVLSPAARTRLASLVDAHRHAFAAAAR